MAFLMHKLIPCSDSYLRVSADIMCINAHEMPETVGHEDRPQPHFHHLLHIALYDPCSLQFLQHHSLGQLMHLNPRNTCNAETITISNGRYVFFLTLTRQSHIVAYKSWMLHCNEEWAKSNSKVVYV